MKTYSMDLKTEFNTITETSKIDVGKKITLRYLKKAQVTTEILSVSVIDNKTIRLTFMVDDDTYIGSQLGDTYKDFYDADLEHVIIDEIESEDWIWM